MIEAARAATAQDLLDVASLARAAIAELETMRGGAVWRRFQGRPEPVDASLADALVDPHQEVVVGSIDGTTVGYGVVRVEGLADGGQLGVIEDLFVDPAARGVGVGEAMMEHVLAWCEGRECIGVDALALPGHRDTKNFFETFGLTARAIIVHRSL